MKFPALLASTAVVSLALIAACATATTRVTGDDDLDASAAVPDADEPNFNTGGDAGGNIKPLEPLGSLTGTVFAPNGTLPLSGALVYLTSIKPAAIPATSFCDKCVELNGADSTLSKPDGTFKLDFFQTGDQYIVVQKGAFRRIRTIKVVAGATVIDDEITTLPPRSQGDDTAPRMAVVTPVYDHIDESLKQLGITQVDMIDAADATTFLSSAAKLSKYHVVFVPCGAGGMTSCSDERTSVPSTKTALKTYVQGGGRLYVTDYSYEYVNQTWPTPIQWASAERGRACVGSWEGTAKWIDPGLKSWMTSPAVNGTAPVELEGNYSAILGVRPYSAKDETGAVKTLTPKVWAQGQRNGTFEPSTVSFQDTCGRVLFSTYHSENSGGTALAAQEKALLYILLEVNTCVGTIGQPG